MTTDEKYMARCIQLARNGEWSAAPNPMVGALLVCNGNIIGEGYHIRCGGPHAEVNAIRSVRDERQLTESTLYVSLEPCSHHGKTPPCADLIIEKKIPKVVIGCIDPFAKVSGRGVQKLKDAGVDVTVGVLERECKALNRNFFLFHTRKRPYVTLKWAESADGFMDRKRKERGEGPVIFSTPYTQMLVHETRSRHQAIMVGTRTALLDNPSLSVRYWSGNQPLRLVLDRTGSLPADLNLFDGTSETVVYMDVSAPVPSYADKLNVSCVRLDFRLELLPQIMNDLYGRSVQSLLVEGGSCLLQQFLAVGLWDEVRVERSPCLLGSGVPSPPCPDGCRSSVTVDGHVLLNIRHEDDAAEWTEH